MKHLAKNIIGSSTSVGGEEYIYEKFFNKYILVNKKEYLKKYTKYISPRSLVDNERMKEYEAIERMKEYDIRKKNDDIIKKKINDIII